MACKPLCTRAPAPPRPLNGGLLKPFAITVLFGSGLLILNSAANAQGPYPQRDDPYYRNGPNGYDDDRQRNDYPDQARYGDDRSRYAGNQGTLIGRVLSDLSRAAANTRFDGRERKHFDEGARQLKQFENRWAQGKFDTGKLHEAIEELDQLAKSDRVSGRDREILARDAADLRQFQSSRGRYSNRGYGDYRDDRYNQNRRYDPNWR